MDDLATALATALSTPPNATRESVNPFPGASRTISYRTRDCMWAWTQRVLSLNDVATSATVPFRTSPVSARLQHDCCRTIVRPDERTGDPPVGCCLAREAVSWQLSRQLST